MRFTLGEIAKISQAEVSWSSEADKEARVELLLTDSRHLLRSENCLFIALKTAKNDGHKYIAEAYAQGIRMFMVERWQENQSEFKDTSFIKVSDTLQALQTIAECHRKKFSIPVVGITGSNGKTIVKEWLGHLLEQDKKVVKNPKSYNSQIGVPLSVWEMNEGCDIGLFEAGISMPGEMEKLEKIIKPDIGIFTNIGAAHESNFLDLTQKIAEKLKLFVNVKKLIFCAEHYAIKERINSIPLFKKMELLTWASDPNIHADLRVIEKNLVEEDGKSVTCLRAEYKDTIVDITIPFRDKASIENAMHCWLFMLEMGYSQSVIQERMKGLQSVEMRMEMKEGDNHNFIINDSYNSDFNSFVIAVDFLRNQSTSRRKRIVLSDILQSGVSEYELYSDVSKVLKDQKIDAIVGIGPQICSKATLFSGMDATFYLDTETFLREFDTDKWGNEIILLKGARLFAFERIVARLQKKVHGTVMEIDMNAMIHNLNFFRSKLKVTTKIMIMGKAFSYGSGSHEIANSLAFYRSDYITVAYTDEGVALRKKGIELPIMVVNAEDEGVENVLRYKLEPEIYSFRMWDVFRTNLRNYLNNAEKETVYIHIKLDTGMHRLGFEEEDLKRLVESIRAEAGVKVKSVFTHLATADDPEKDECTLRQLQKFDKMSSFIKSEFSYGDTILRHALNTAGICRFPDYQYDMVRLGIGLYGVGVTKEMEGELETVSTLKTTIAQIRTIKKGEAVGYGRKYIAPCEKKIGVIGVGYADGLNRHLSNGVGKVSIKGQIVPIIGNICMDMCMLDLSGIEAEEGDEVILFGKEWPIKNISDALQTIPYEILTSISQRVKRVYYQE